MYKIIFEDENGTKEELANIEKIEIAKFFANEISHKYCKHNYKNCRLYIEKESFLIAEYNTYYK
jgi:hypothetical protein